MFCPKCGIQMSEEIKFCTSCGANLRGVREVMNNRSEQFDWSKTWVAEMFLTREEMERRRGITPEQKRADEIKAGVITSSVGIGVMIFLHFLLEAIAQTKGGPEAEILRRVWLVGIIPFLIGLGIIFNGLFVSRRVLRPADAQPHLAAERKPALDSIPAKTTSQLLIESGVMPMDFSITDEETAQFPPGRETADPVMASKPQK